MAVFSSSVSSEIPLLDEIVSVGGGNYDALWCSSISRATGAGGTQAEFILPSYLWDSYRRDLRDAQVAVSVFNSYRGGSGTDFAGYLDVENAQLDASTDQVKISANTITAYLGKVWVGQARRRSVVRYPLKDQLGRPTSWKPSRILEDLFGTGSENPQVSPSGGMPSFWRARLKLGDVSVLNTTSQTLTPELVFRNTNYQAAIEQICALFGDVTFIERFSGSATYLDFFRIQDASLPRVSVQVAEFKDPVKSGANVASITHNQTAHDTITRVIVVGSPKRFIVTVGSDDADPAKQLVKGWDQSLEAAVLANPKAAKVGAPGWAAGMELVFRRWLLPSCFSNATKCKDLGFKGLPVTGPDGVQDGATYQAQIYKAPTILTFDTDGIATGAYDPDNLREQIKSCKLQLDKGYFELNAAEDGLNILKIEPSLVSDVPKTTWVQAPIRITFAIEHPGEFVYGDTGQPAYSQDIMLDFNADGLTDWVPRDDLEFVQFTNVGYPLYSAAGAALEFESVYFNQDVTDWIVTPTASVYRDDTQVAEKLAQEILRSKNRRHHSYLITVPFFSRAYAVGNLIEIRGQANYEGQQLMITQVSHDLINNSTSITCDNVRPPTRRLVRMQHEGQR